MDKFEEWWEDFDFEIHSDYGIAQEAFAAGQKSRQAEVEEQHKINVALNSETIRQREQIQHYMNKSVDKNKRIEEALKEIFHCRVIGADRIYTCDVIEKALRGERE